MFTEFAYHPAIIAFVFASGACIGSFLNVCIYRIPLERSVVFPGSHCAACGAPIPGRFNIPIVSYFWLRGRAACCGTRIDQRYWIIEAFTATLALLLYIQFSLPLFLAYFFMTAGLIAASCIDMDHFIIPDRFTLGGCVAGLAWSALVPELHGRATAWEGFTEGLRGAVAGGLSLYLIAKVGGKVFKKEAMGLGDVKFLAAMGAFLGMGSILFLIPVSSLMGSVLGIWIMIAHKGSWGTRIPYGPFLAAAALAWILGGHAWATQYWHYAMETLKSV